MRKPKLRIEDVDRNLKIGGAASSGLQWFDPTQPPFRLSGFAWFQQEHRYRRLPHQPAEKIPEAVDFLANNTAGGQIAFQTDSRHVVLRVHLADLSSFSHMAVTGQHGFDLYVGPPGRQRFGGTAVPPVEKRRYESTLFQHPDRQRRSFLVNFPLYGGVRKVEVGLDSGAVIAPPPPFSQSRPVVIYGTSITQGGCASRPGMAYTNILGRKLNVEIINLGFSGSGRGEPEVARLMAGISDPSLLVLDYDANNVSDSLRRTLPVFIRILRGKHPQTPILVVSRPPFGGDSFHRGNFWEKAEKRDIQRDTVRRLRMAGDRHLFFLDGSCLMGKDFDECTVDGVHPTDLGFYRMAANMKPVFHRILAGRCDA